MGDPDHVDHPWWHTFFDETYADFGLRSDDPEYLQRAADFIIEHLQLAPGGLLFDQCCGVGRISLPLARRGIRIVGVDLAESYVRRARDAAEAESLPCRFFCGDALRFTAPEPCDAAINWFTSFGYHEDDEQNIAMLQSAHASLRPGGRLALEFLSVPKLLSEFRPTYFERQPLADGGELLVLIDAEIDFPRGMINQTWTFVRPDGRREQRPVRSRMLMPHELVALLRRSGFQAIELFGSLDGEPFERRSRRVIAVGEKSGTKLQSRR